MKKCIVVSFIVLVCFLFVLVFYPNPVPSGSFSVKVRKGDSFSYLSKQLSRSGVIERRSLFTALGKMSGLDRRLVPGGYTFAGKVSLWNILQRLAEGKPNLQYFILKEGWTLKQIRETLRSISDLRHEFDSEKAWSAWLQRESLPSWPEGRFFPDTYAYAPGESDRQILNLASRTMKKHLGEVWQHRAGDLPYHDADELLIMASLIEKETGHPDDRGKVAGVFVNRLRLGMRLQTDPSVIYGLGDAYTGRLTRTMLRQDTPYNTYTRAGLTPTPIAAPSLNALKAAAHPEQTKALYFVAKGDGTGQSYFSDSLREHNRAVQSYILNKKNRQG